MTATQRKMRLLDWQRVRRLSQLTLLNRVVLSMLVVIPLVVAIWPNYQLTVERYHSAVDLARGKLNVRMRAPSQTEEDIPAHTDVADIDKEPVLAGGSEPNANAPETQFPAEQSSDETNEADTPLEESTRVPIADAGGWIRAWGTNVPILETRVEAAVVERSQSSKRPTTIPRTWALAFIAALFILAGDTIQQIFCPLIIRRESLDEFVERRLQVYATSPSSILLQQAIQEMALPAESDTTAEEANAKEPTNFRGPDGQQLGIVHLASSASYQELSRRAPLAILCCFVMYTTGALILAKILQEQTLNVLAAAGWLT